MSAVKKFAIRPGTEISLNNDGIDHIMSAALDGGITYWCSLCGQGMWNGRCENPDCENHWHPKEDYEDE